MIFPLKERVKKDKGQTTVTKKQKKEIGKLLNIINEVEDTAVQIKMGIVTYDMLQREQDASFQNKLERYLYLRKLTHLFLFQFLEPKDFILEVQDANVEIIEQIFRFKKRHL